MKMIDLAKIDGEGLQTLLVGLNHPGLSVNPFIKELYLALSVEWLSRETGKPEKQEIDLPLSTLTDHELKQAAGFFYGFCMTIKVSEYRGTFNFCFGLLHSLLEEFQVRATECQAMLN